MSKEILEQCKKEIAHKHGYPEFKNIEETDDLCEAYVDEVAELFSYKMINSKCNFCCLDDDRNCFMCGQKPSMDDNFMKDELKAIPPSLLSESVKYRNEKSDDYSTLMLWINRNNTEETKVDHLFHEYISNTSFKKGFDVALVYLLNNPERLKKWNH